MMNRLNRGLSLISIALIAISCTNSENERQPGTRYSLDGTSLTQPSGGQEPVGLASSSNGNWSQHLGDAEHVMPNAALANPPRLVAKVNLGVDVRRPVNGASAPIIVNNIVYLYDAAGYLHAIGIDGREIWRVSLIPNGEQAGDGFGGGVAYANGTVFASTGYGEVVAVSAANGGVIWRYKQGAPLRKPPLVSQGKVIVISEGVQAVALDANTGSQVWRHYSAQSTIPTRLNAGVPASNDSNTVLAYASGQLTKVNTSNGGETWNITSISDFITGSKAVNGDITGDPVISGDRIIVGTLSGVSAISLQTGQSIWNVKMGTKGPLIVSGNSIFGLTSTERLYRLSISTGQVGWSIAMPKKAGLTWFAPKIQYFDPRLVNNEIWVFDDKGILRRYSPANGGLISESQMPQKLATAPVFGDQAMAAVSQRGELLIYR